MSANAVEYAKLVERAKLYVERLDLGISGRLDSATRIGAEIRELTGKISELTDCSDELLAEAGELRTTGDDLDAMISTLVTTLTAELTGRAEANEEALAAARERLDEIGRNL